MQIWTCRGSPSPGLESECWIFSRIESVWYLRAAQYSSWVCQVGQRRENEIDLSVHWGCASSGDTAVRVRLGLGKTIVGTLLAVIGGNPPVETVVDLQRGLLTLR
jgi:hypothetical protein